MRHPLLRLIALCVVVALVAGCGASRTFSRGERAARAGNWDVAVEEFRQAFQAEPDNVEYRLALERAMLNASAAHLDQARIFEARNQLGEALREYRRASELDPPNRQIAAKATEIERRIRDENEANRPRPLAQREPPRPGSAPAPLASLNTIVDPRFVNASLRDVLNTLGEAAGIDVQYERDYQDRMVSVTMQRSRSEKRCSRSFPATASSTRS
jgi:YD repeat-containing protein